MNHPIVTVLRCDDVPEPDRTRHGDTHIRMLRHLERAAAKAGLSLDLRSVDVVGGELPAEDDPSDLFVTTGSATDPDSAAPWVVAFSGWLQRTILRKRPVYGVCFGHQVLAHALGGTTSRHPKGWEIGSVAMRKRFSLPVGGARKGLPLCPSTDEHAEATAEGETVRLLMSHQDIVVERPASAVAWMVGTFCRDQGYVIPGLAVTVQGHPEFEPDQVSDIYRRRRERLGDAATDAAIASAQTGHDGLAVTVEVLRYFLG